MVFWYENNADVRSADAVDFMNKAETKKLLGVSDCQLAAASEAIFYSSNLIMSFVFFF